MALELATGIAGLIALADVIVVKGSRFYALSKNAIPEIQGLLKEVASLAGALLSLEKTVGMLNTIRTDQGEDESISLVYIEDCQKCILELEAVLQKCGPKDVTKWEKAKASLKWPLSVSETREQAQKVQRLRSTISASLEADSLQSLCTLLSGQQSVQESLKRVEKGQERAARLKERKKLDRHQKEILDWFSTYKTWKHAEMKRERYPGTSVWFRDCQEYKDWLAIPKSALWFDGIPGAGKSVLTSAIIEDLELLEDSKTALAYFYIEYSSEESQKFHTMAGTLLRQLVETNPESFSILESYKASGDFSDTTVEEVLEMVIKLSNFYSTTMLVIDGLDECDRTRDRRDILRFISTLGSAAGSVKIIATSRTIIDIVNSLAGFSNVSIAATSTDVKLYVAGELESRQRSEVEFYGIRLQDPSLKEEIIDTLVNKAHGMFQWVRCQLDTLSRIIGDEKKRLALSDLPRDLPETYRRILDRVDPSNRSLVQAVFPWIKPTDFHAKYVDLESLADIVSHQIHENITDRDIRLSCGSLMKVEARDRTVRFSHFSVQEFIESETARGEWYYSAYGTPIGTGTRTSAANQILFTRYQRILAILDYMRSCQWDDNPHLAHKTVCKKGAGTHPFANYIYDNSDGLFSHWHGDALQSYTRDTRWSTLTDEVNRKLAEIINDTTNPSWINFAENVSQLSQRGYSFISKYRYASTDEIVGSGLHVACFLNSWSTVDIILKENNRSLLDREILGGLTPLHAWLAGCQVYQWTEDLGSSDKFLSTFDKLLPSKGADFKTVLLYGYIYLQGFADVLSDDGPIPRAFKKWIAGMTHEEASQEILEDLKRYYWRFINDESYVENEVLWDVAVDFTGEAPLRRVLLHGGFDESTFLGWLNVLVELLPIKIPRTAKLEGSKAFTVVRSLLDAPKDETNTFLYAQSLVFLVQFGVLEILNDSEAANLVAEIASLAKRQLVRDPESWSWLYWISGIMIVMGEVTQKRGLADRIDYIELSNFGCELTSFLEGPPELQLFLSRVSVDPDAVVVEDFEYAETLIDGVPESLQDFMRVYLDALSEKVTANTNRVIDIGAPAQGSNEREMVSDTPISTSSDPQFKPAVDVSPPNEVLGNGLGQIDEPKQSIGDLVRADPEHRVDKLNPEGETPLQLAIRLHPSQVLETLLRNSPSVDPEPGVSDISSTPLGFAIKLGKIEHIEVLLQFNANRFLVDTQGKTYLHLLVERGEPKLLDVFLSQPVWWIDELVGRPVNSNIQLCPEVFAKGLGAIQPSDPTVPKHIKPELTSIINQINTLSLTDDSASRLKAISPPSMVQDMALVRN
ncbi:hypothetical protein DRE_07556 [Drechslerella stenobrocha 248]|uniref:Nephrocystin 3-like N-terminal domain-containing protein n=1 Tax=Drechslerella stenobrocha 248 TaxID=1043628 RepID=W7HTU3_9PEZI|nr:hypothetical protein DRE_07556 [Drechslerella stenobrocha 248]